MIAALQAWLDRIDPGVHRRIKGLRLVTAYGIAALAGALHDISAGLPGAAALSALAGGFALWASVSEGRASRGESSRDLVILVFGAATGAALTAVLAPSLAGPIPAGAEWTLVIGAFFAGYLRRFGLLGAGIGSQIYIGQLLAYGAGLTSADLPTVAAAAAIAAIAAVVPRVLSGPAEHPSVFSPVASASATAWIPAELAMGLQAALAAAFIVGLNAAFGLAESAWAITACTYIVTSTRAGTIDRFRRRLIGTAIGVPLGLFCLPLAVDAPILAFLAAALAMVIYAMALPERYDIACGAFAFALIVTLAAGGEHSFSLLAARLWETLLGGAIGLATATLLFPLREREPPRSDGAG